MSKNDCYDPARQINFDLKVAAEEKTKMNDDFDEVAAQINAKLKEAAAALREANALGDQLGLPGLIYTQWIGDDLRWKRQQKEISLTEDELETKLEEYEEKLNKIDVSDLEESLQAAGWSTSSSYC